MDMPPDVSALVAFATAVEAGSFSSAGRILGTSPSAVSKAIARLERRFGIRLFQRSTRVLSLTPEGAAYYERVSPLLRALDDASEVMQPAATAQGRLRITAPGDLGRLLMTPIVNRFLPAHPDLKLEMSLADRHVDLIREGFDLAIRAGRVADSELNARQLAQLPLTLVASPAYLKRCGTPRSIGDLPRHAHVRYLLAGSPFPITFASGEVVRPEGVFDTDDGTALRAAALGGLGIIQILRLAVAEDLAAGRLTEVLPEAQLPRVPVSVLHAFGRHAPMGAGRVIEFMADQLQSLA